MAKKTPVPLDADVLLLAVAASGLIDSKATYERLRDLIVAKAKRPKLNTASLLKRFKEVLKDKLPDGEVLEVPPSTPQDENSDHEARVYHRRFPKDDTQAVAIVRERTKPLEEITGADVPRGLSPEDVAIETPPAVSEASSEVSPDVTFLDALGTGGIGLESEDYEVLGQVTKASAIQQELAQYLAKIKFGQGGVHLMAKPHELAGKKCFLASTWQITTDKAVWNLMGQVQEDETALEGISLARCSSDMLFEGEPLIRMTGKTVWPSWALSSGYGGAFPGETFTEVKVSWFVYALAFPKPGWYYRLWFNERCRDNQHKKDLTRRTYDLGTGRRIR